MPEISSSSFSETDASNSAAAPNGWPEGMNPSGVNDSGRAGWGAIKRFWGRIQGRYAATGSANAFVVTADAALAAYVTGERYSFRANHTITGSASVNWGTAGVITLKKYTSSGTAVLASGDIQNGQPVTFEYDGTDAIVVSQLATDASGGTVTSVATGAGLTGGPITGAGTIDFDVNNLVEDTNPDLAADFVASYDTSASGHKKVLLDKLAGSGLQSVQVFTAGGIWTKPAGITLVRVRVVGGGGGGGGAGADQNQASGGGGGGYAEEIIDVSVISSETVTVGAGGAGGAAGNNNGVAGGTSSFGAHCSATGGGGGLSSNNSAVSNNPGGAAGAGIGGDINATGEEGTGARTTVTDPSGAGGSSLMGGGAQGLVGGAGIAGRNGGNYGGGGSGAWQNPTDTAGGNGAGGIVIVEEFIK